ncbi:MAG: hypothetical protein ABIS06_13155 [Vicinamibacterales bacterium]
MTKVFKVALGLMLLLAAATGARAQDVSTTRNTLDRATRTGDTLTIETREGVKVEGRLVGIGTDSLLLNTAGAERPFAYKDLDRVRRRRNGVLLGAVIGLGAGIALGILPRMILNNEGADGDLALIGVAAIGLGTGVAIDGLVSRNRMIFRRSEGPVRLGVEPLRGGASVRVGVRW